MRRFSASEGAVANPEPDRTGSYCAGYRLVRKLGHGGAGVVYLAERPGNVSPRWLALKLLSSAPDGREGRCLQEEERILSSLDHPGIARLIEAGRSAHGQLRAADRLLRCAPAPALRPAGSFPQSLPGRCARPPASRRPSRPKAAKHPGRPEGPPLASRFRHRSASRRWRRDRERPRRLALSRLREPGAGPRRSNFTGLRHLLSRDHPLRNVDRHPSPARRSDGTTRLLCLWCSPAQRSDSPRRARLRGGGGGGTAAP